MVGNEKGKKNLTAARENLKRPGPKNPGGALFLSTNINNGHEVGVKGFCRPMGP
jgi:hypothetical protein